MLATRTCLALSLGILAVGASLQPSAAAEGFNTVQSASDFRTTTTKLAAAIKARNLIAFTDIDHGAGAASVGLQLRPTYLFVFGNPRGGTPAMICAQTVGLDLPLKALVFEDAAGKVQIVTPDPAEMAKRHALGDCAKPAIEAMSKALAGIAADAAAP